MEELQRILSAGDDPEAREDLIDENIGFICRCASKATGRYVDRHDDLWSAAVLAFDEALRSYRPERGSFHAYAALVIRSRVTDRLRQENRRRKILPFSALTRRNDRGEEQPFDAEDPGGGLSEAALEIFSLKAELETFGISFYDLPESSPKTAKTREACLRAARLIAEDRTLLKKLRTAKKLPVQRLLRELDINEKVPERHRDYIIAGVLILSGGYTVMTDYFAGKGGR